MSKALVERGGERDKMLCVESKRNPSYDDLFCVADASHLFTFNLSNDHDCRVPTVWSILMIFIF